VTERLGATADALTRDMAALRGQMQERITALEARLEALNKEVGNRLEMTADRVTSSGRRGVFWNLVLMLLLGLAGIFAALNWPMIRGMYDQNVAPPAASTAPAPAAEGAGG
jgi:hypothetical protein